MIDRIIVSMLSSSTNAPKIWSIVTINQMLFTEGRNSVRVIMIELNTIESLNGGNGCMCPITRTMPLVLDFADFTHLKPINSFTRLNSIKEVFVVVIINFVVFIVEP